MRNSAIAASGLRKAYKDKIVLDGIDLDVETGTISSLLGPNGAGKTTTINVLTTLIEADGGTARVAGHDVATETKAVRAAADGTPIREIVGEDPVEFVEAFVQNYSKGGYVPTRERERLVSAIERAAGEDTGKGRREV